MSYTAEIEFDRHPRLVRCQCGDCGWKCRANKLAEIDGAILTPGDPSPAGRCPKCGALAYVIGRSTVTLTREAAAAAESFIAGFEDDDGGQNMAPIRAALAGLRAALKE